MQREMPTLPCTNGAIAGVDAFVLEPPGLGTALRVSIAQPATPALGSATDPFEVAFLVALRDCVIPEVERRIEGSDPGHRVLLGTSAGGHFAVHALVHPITVQDGETRLMQSMSLLAGMKPTPSCSPSPLPKALRRQA